MIRKRLLMGTVLVVAAIVATAVVMPANDESPDLGTAPVSVAFPVGTWQHLSFEARQGAKLTAWFETTDFGDLPMNVETPRGTLSSESLNALFLVREWNDSLVVVGGYIITTGQPVRPANSAGLNIDGQAHEVSAPYPFRQGRAGTATAGFNVNTSLSEGTYHVLRIGAGNVGMRGAFELVGGTLLANETGWAPSLAIPFRDWTHETAADHRARIPFLPESQSTMTTGATVNYEATGMALVLVALPRSNPATAEYSYRAADFQSPDITHTVVETDQPTITPQFWTGRCAPKWCLFDGGTFELDVTHYEARGDDAENDPSVLIWDAGRG